MVGDFLVFYKMWGYYGIVGEKCCMKNKGCVVLLGRDHNLKLKGQQRLSDDRGIRMQAI